MEVKFRVEGFKEAEQALMELPKATAKASVRRWLKALLIPIADAGRSNAPERMGTLKESYGVGTRLTKRQRKVSRRESEVEVYAGPGQDGAAQGVQTEFGNEHQAAQPHLRPAWDAHKGGLLEKLKPLMWADIEKTVARFRKRQAKAGK